MKRTDNSTIEARDILLWQTFNDEYHQHIQKISHISQYYRKTSVNMSK